VLGVIYARQFLLASRLEQNLTLSRLVRQVRFVPEIQRADELLEDFRRSGTNLAIVVDEYGGTAGLITLKDAVERMVGDLDMDEAPGESQGPPAELISPRRWRVNGRLSIHDWAEAFGSASIPPRVSTVGGLVTALLGRVPRPGDTVRVANIELTVERTDRGRVDTVILRLDLFGDSESADATPPVPPS
jgi:magnesium and cobalt transporter